MLTPFNSNKDTAAFSYFQIFFNFFCIFFSLSAIRHIYTGFFALFVAALLPVVVCSVGVLVVVVCPVFLNHTRVHIHARTRIFKR